MRLLGITRSSNQDIANGYGPAIQQAEIITYCANGHKLIACRQVTEPATIELEERELFQAVLAEASHLKAAGQCDGVVFSRCDRLSRRLESAIQVALDLRKAGLSIHLIREGQILKPDDPPIGLVMFILQAFGVDTQTRVSLANTRQGQIKNAQAGKLPSGVGARGLFGYNLVGPQGEKYFEPNSQVWIVDMILKLGINGCSINAITRRLQQQGITITRDTVRKILKHARVYAGVYKWGEYKIRGLIRNPRISEDEAAIIEANMKQNREKSLGFGKRKWLTGRVFCGVCGRKYALEMGARRCHCRARTRLEYLNPCLTSPVVSYKKLEQVVLNLLNDSLATPENVERALLEMKQNCEEEESKVHHEVGILTHTLSQLTEKKKRLSWQHSEGLLSNEELKSELDKLQPQIEAMEHRLQNYETILSQLVGKSQNSIEDITACICGCLALSIIADAQDKEDKKTKLAETIDLRVTILPSESADFRLELSANIPLVATSVDVDRNGNAIVCPSLRKKSIPFPSG
mgnify:CR=1 FL=1